MSTLNLEPKARRTVGGTECTWCRAVRGGTGIAVVALLTSKPPNIPRLQNALHTLQNTHPILRSRLHHGSTANAFSFITSPTPFVRIVSHEYTPSVANDAVSPLQQILELELNRNAWLDRSPSSCEDMLFASVYTMPNQMGKCVVVLRLHVSACDRTTAVQLLMELLVLMEENGSADAENYKGECSWAIEDLMPRAKAKKGVWARGLDMLSYSLNSFRLTNLKFFDTKSTRFSQGCKWSGIKLCGAVMAAGLMAAHCSKRSSRKYGIITLTDCRYSLASPLFGSFGFYHSAILNSHEMRGGEALWELAKKTYGAFASSKRENRHFTDMADLNFLMCKAMENPGLTPSSSLRTSIMSVFEDTVVYNGGQKQREVGVEDYMGCASVHGVGPSMAIFDTIRDGSLDCVCVYPAPLHSREQMLELVGKMKAILIEAAKTYKE
ncbi:hypothetical protein RJT34_23718 [Clitoria ternatea]|uniref:Uncharacterized protein n=1 Tax=Clitoria ternatea TaxID=43366 RepID=A0AAN9FT83_CLITE